MGTSPSLPGIAAGRLTPQDYTRNFSDLHPPLDDHQAFVEAGRCYFCFDAPCTIACPTSIDIPLFIRQILTEDAKSSALTIFQQNILGGMCARVCPTETLCEEACVREAAEGKPIKIGLLQRYATDAYLANGKATFTRSASTGKSVAVVGGGPAGLACAHRLSLLGNDVTVYEARKKLGGLNEFGIATYKATDDFAQKEASFVLSLGGIDVKSGYALGENLRLADLRKDFDAVFLGLGLGGVNGLGLDNEDLTGVRDAIDYIGELRQVDDKAKLPVGRRIVVIGGGMTAVDAAIQTKRLGADEVTMVYRRGQEHMKASRYEQELAQTNGVQIVYWAKPVELIGEDGSLSGVRFERTRLDKDGRLAGTGDTFDIAADMAFKAIGQKFMHQLFENDKAPKLASGRIKVNENRQTSLSDVWAGGDCIEGGDDLTVTAVDDGRTAAEAIDKFLRTSSPQA